MKVGVIQVVFWTFSVFLSLGFALVLVAGISPELAKDPVVAAAVQSAVYLGACSLFASRRPGRTWSETFALRRTSIWLVVAALVMGVSTCLPASVLAGWVERLAPLSEAERVALDSWFTPRSPSHAVALFVFAAGIAVFSEELLFRGAFYTGLRPHHTPASAGWTTGILFTLSHEPRFWPAILVLSGLLATVRAVSGSLWPSLFLHIGFNATALGMPFVHPSLKEPGTGIVIASLAASVSLLGLIVWVGRSSTMADRARQVDLEPDPGLGETES